MSELTYPEMIDEALVAAAHVLENTSDIYKTIHSRAWDAKNRYASIFPNEAIDSQIIQDLVTLETAARAIDHEFIDGMSAKDERYWLIVRSLSKLFMLVMDATPGGQVVTAKEV